MPRLPINYENTIIYKIVCKDLSVSDCYIGHTTNFVNRKRLHKSGCKTRTYKLYEIINQNGGWNNWTMVMIEKYPCSDFHTAGAREHYWIEQLNPSLNMKSPSMGIDKTEWFKQYRIDNSEKNKEYQCNRYSEKKELYKEYSTRRVCCILCKREINQYYLKKHQNIQHNISTQNIST